jgi:hypothetical protein
MVKVHGCLGNPGHDPERCVIMPIAAQASGNDGVSKTAM